MAFICSLLLFVILLGVVVVVHELGHLVVARASGVFCEAFSFGFGPVLLAKKDKKETEWRLSLFPLGGYLKMFGDADVSSVREVIPAGYTEDDMERMSVHRKKPWQRLLISAGGPFANFILSVFVIFTLSLMQGIPEHTNTISVKDENSLAYTSGLRDGDVIVEANGSKINNFEELKSQIVASRGTTLKLLLQRNGETEELSIDMFTEEDGKVIPVEVLGITPQALVYKNASIAAAAKVSVTLTYFMAYENIRTVFKVITRQASYKNVGGLISIFKVSERSAEAGFFSFILMIAMISSVLGAVNLLPIPMLDGGAIVIAIVECVLGRPLNKKFVEFIFIVGLVVVASLMLLGTWNDLVNCKIFNWLETLFK
ncbi:MAG: M50 family metallopeptidase [Holosporales bacterium]|jgi:regulator of sigma E protease|nr:M50 family metallopeptidase [Holosporales bacterium]